MKAHYRAMERHLPYGITQCYLPLDTNEHAQGLPLEATNQSIA